MAILAWNSYNLQQHNGYLQQSDQIKSSQKKKTGNFFFFIRQDKKGTSSLSCVSVRLKTIPIYDFGGFILENRKYVPKTITYFTKRFEFTKADLSLFYARVFWMDEGAPTIKAWGIHFIMRGCRACVGWHASHHHGNLRTFSPTRTYK